MKRSILDHRSFRCSVEGAAKSEQRMSSFSTKLATMSTDGEVANALVCKTSIHGFKSHSVLQKNL